MFTAGSACAGSAAPKTYFVSVSSSLPSLTRTNWRPPAPAGSTRRFPLIITPPDPPTAAAATGFGSSAVSAWSGILEPGAIRMRNESAPQGWMCTATAAARARSVDNRTAAQEEVPLLVSVVQRRVCWRCEALRRHRGITRRLERMGATAGAGHRGHTSGGIKPRRDYYL